MVDGEVLMQSDVEGVLTLLPCVYPAHLEHIDPDERLYVASEMTASLLFWLHGLRCPVLNRPATTCLGGPLWHREKWLYVAARGGIRSRKLRRASDAPESCFDRSSLTALTVIGDRVFGNTEPCLQRNARRIAGLAGVQALSVYFDGTTSDAEFVGADIFPDFTEGVLADAALDYLREGNAKRE